MYSIFEQFSDISKKCEESPLTTILMSILIFSVNKKNYPLHASRKRLSIFIFEYRNLLFKAN